LERVDAEVAAGMENNKDIVVVDVVVVVVVLEVKI
jgi:hypothetical protein